MSIYRIYGLHKKRLIPEPRARCTQCGGYGEVESRESTTGRTTCTSCWGSGVGWGVGTYELVEEDEPVSALVWR